MQTSRSFNKQIPVLAEADASSAVGVVLEVTGANPCGFSIIIENQHASNTMVYWFETSSDGEEYTRLPFANGGTDNQFQLTFGKSHNVKVTATASYIRLKAYGDVPAAFTITSFKKTSVAAADVVEVTL